MKNTLGGQFTGTSRTPNEGPARHSSEALNVIVLTRVAKFGLVGRTESPAYGR